ncbi:MAG: Na+/H+ antiporter subunit E [Ilumatobacter sp.]|jgi:multicomponent Na+:H+ antiporter subunit E|uniref:Na+/H+ antiporter subunit E n=1 Tax=Ilumatobacter sp. TaxID=1967498 RepID=UPI003918C353
MSSTRVDLRRTVTVRRAITVVLLTAAWCALWRAFSVANVASGLLVSSASLAVGVRSDTRGGVRILPLLRLLWLVSVDLVASTVTVVREVLTPTDHTDEAIVAVPIPKGSEHHLLLLFVAITVTPGTAVVASESDATIIYLHVLHADRVDSVIEHVRTIAEVANRALPHAQGAPADFDDGPVPPKQGATP